MIFHSVTYNISKGSVLVSKDTSPSIYLDGGWVAATFLFPGGNPSDLTITDSGSLLVKDQDYFLSEVGDYLQLDISTPVGDLSISGTGLGTTYSIGYNLTNMCVFLPDIDVDYKIDTCASGASFTFQLAAYSGHRMPASLNITMGGTTLTEGVDYTYTKTGSEVYFWDRGTVVISSVTGNVSITGAGVSNTPLCQKPTFPLTISLENLFFANDRLAGKYAISHASFHYDDGLPVPVVIENQATNPYSYSLADFCGLGCQYGLSLSVLPNVDYDLPTTIVATYNGSDVSNLYSIVAIDAESNYGSFSMPTEEFFGPINVVMAGVSQVVTPPASGTISVLVVDGKLITSSGGGIMAYSPSEPASEFLMITDDLFSEDTYLANMGLDSIGIKHAPPASDTTSTFDVEFDAALQNVELYIRFQGEDASEDGSGYMELDAEFEEKESNVYGLSEAINTTLSDYTYVSYVNNGEVITNTTGKAINLTISAVIGGSPTVSSPYPSDMINATNLYIKYIWTGTNQPTIEYWDGVPGAGTLIKSGTTFITSGGNNYGAFTNAVYHNGDNSSRNLTAYLVSTTNDFNTVTTGEVIIKYVGAENIMTGYIISIGVWNNDGEVYFGLGRNGSISDEYNDYDYEQEGIIPGDDPIP